MIISFYKPVLISEILFNKIKAVLHITSKLGDVCAVSFFQISNTKNEALLKILYQNRRHKCGEAQAGTPAQCLAAVVRWAALADNDEAFKVYLLKDFN